MGWNNPFGTVGMYFTYYAVVEVKDKCSCAAVQNEVRVTFSQG